MGASVFALIFLHIATGAVAVLLGAVALATRKGRTIHVSAGRGFVVLMATSSLTGGLVGLIRFEQFFITFFAGLLGTYLVLSGWRAAQQQSCESSAFDFALMAMNALNFTGLLALGSLGLAQADGLMFGFAAENYLFLALMAGIALASDLSLLLRQTLADNYRIARHLWRMLLGFFIAAGSAFTGPGATVFPQWLQESGALSLPELLILLAMVFYLIRTVFFAPKTG